MEAGAAIESNPSDKASGFEDADRIDRRLQPAA
jgi:hypothetical protein